MKILYDISPKPKDASESHEKKLQQEIDVLKKRITELEVENESLKSKNLLLQESKDPCLHFLVRLICCLHLFSSPFSQIIVLGLPGLLATLGQSLVSKNHSRLFETGGSSTESDGSSVGATRLYDSKVWWTPNYVLCHL